MKTPLTFQDLAQLKLTDNENTRLLDLINPIFAKNRNTGETWQVISKGLIERNYSFEVHLFVFKTIHFLYFMAIFFTSANHFKACA